MSSSARWQDAEALRLLRFAIVGGGATGLYLVLSLLLHAWGIAAALASLLAYGAAGLFSYIGHYFFTFRSSRQHARTVPLFSMLSAAGYGIAFLAPWLLVEQLGQPIWTAVFLTCVAVPLINFLALRLVVFRG